MHPSSLPCTLLFISLASFALSAPPLKTAGVTSSSGAAAGKTFDYIVVGGGLAGITVAARLTENSAITVLLVEAGADNRNDSRVYDIYNFAQAFGSDLDWNWPADQGRTIPGFVRHIFSRFTLSMCVYLLQWQNPGRQLLDQRRSIYSWFECSV